MKGIGFGARERAVGRDFEFHIVVNLGVEIAENLIMKRSRIALALGALASISAGWPTRKEC